MEQFETLDATTTLVAAIISLVVYIIIAIGMWRMFKKMGAPGICAFIPIVNVFVLYNKVRGSAWKALLLLIPIFGEIYGIITNFKLARSFGKGFFFGLGLLIFPEIFYLVLGFGKAKYIGPRR